MLVSVRQLNRLIEITVPAPALAGVLEEIGHEVERISDCPALDALAYCATITDKRPHPELENLHVFQVSSGAQILTLVSSNRLLEPGMSVALVAEGGSVAGRTVRARDFGGICSQAVFVSAADLGLPDPEWLPEVGGVLRIYPDGAQGTLNEIMDLPDSQIGLKPTPNRGDCLCVLGLARELSARLKLAWRCPAWAPARPGRNARPETSGGYSENGQALAVGPVERAPYYALATVSLPGDRDWSAQPSPLWLQEALRRFGQRPISMLVDLSNYYLFFYGQPMHIFDADRISGAVSVRRSRAGEVFSTLDHQEITLRADALVVADQEKIIALAGIYGGDLAAIDAHTRRIAVECACFEPGAIRGRPRLYGLNTESALRYEHGVDERAGDQILSDFLESAKKLIPAAEILGVETFRRPWVPRKIALTRARIGQYLGFFPDFAETEAILEALGLRVEKSDDRGSILAHIPSWRGDITHDVCLIEELLRMGQMSRVERRLGFSGVADSTVGGDFHTRQWLRLQQVRRDWISRGFSEVCTYSFVNEEDERVFFPVGDTDLSGGLQGVSGFCTHYGGAPAADAKISAKGSPVRIVNPLSSDMNVLRRSQIPSLCRLLVFHRNRQHDDARLFETGSVFRAGASGIEQVFTSSGLIYGRAFPEQWGQDKRAVDFYDLLGLVQNHLQQFAPALPFEYRRSTQAHLHPLQSADLFLDDRNYGYIGSLHPRIRQHYALSVDTLVFEFDNAVYGLASPVRQAQVYSTAPHIRRDLSFLVPGDLPASQLLAEIERFGLKNLQKSSIFDLYTGPNIDSDYKSVSLLLIFGQKNTNLLESEVDQSCQRLIERLRSALNVKLRN